MSVAQTQGGQTQDKLVFYASIFVYQPKLKAEFHNYSPTI
jgi:hypothetical protein